MPVLATVFGLIYAVLVDRTRVEKLAKALVFLPMAISMVGASIIWKFVYEYRQAGATQIGLLNQILVWLGLDPYQFLITEPWNTFFLIVVMIWIQAGFAMTVLSAAIKAVPDDIVEAAQIDGATGFKLFRKVTVPTIRPAVVVVHHHHRHGLAEGLRHRPDHDRRQLRHVGGGQRVLHPVVPAG